VTGISLKAGEISFFETGGTPGNSYDHCFIIPGGHLTNSRV